MEIFFMSIYWIFVNKPSWVHIVITIDRIIPDMSAPITMPTSTTLHLFNENPHLLRQLLSASSLVEFFSIGIDHTFCRTLDNELICVWYIDSRILISLNKIWLWSLGGRNKFNFKHCLCFNIIFFYFNKWQTSIEWTLYSN